MRRQPDSTAPSEVATDGGWGATASQESVDDETTAPDGWHHPLYDQRHTAANLNVPARPAVRSFSADDGGWIAAPSQSTVGSVTSPLVTTDYVIVGVDQTVVVISRENGDVFAEHQLPANVAGLAQKPDADIVVALSAPVDVADATAEPVEDDQPEAARDADDAPVEPRNGPDEDVSGEASESGSPPEEPQSTDGKTFMGQFETDDATTDAETDAGGNTRTVSTDELHEFAAVAGTETKAVDPESDWAVVCGIDLTGDDIVWRRFTELGLDTLEALRFPVFADGRYYVPSRPVVSSGSAGRDVGEIGGFDVESGDVGGYVSYPYQDFNSTPRGPPLVSDDGDFHFHAGGKAGEVVRIGMVLSRPAWQSYVGVPGEAEWQPLLSEGVLVAPGNGGETVGIDAETGDVEWTNDAALATAPAARAAAHGGFFLATDDSTVRCLLIDSGTEVWTSDLAEVVAANDGEKSESASPPLTSVVLAADIVLAGYGEHCVALDAETGTLRWVETPFPDAERIERIAVSDAGLCLVGNDGRVAWAALESTAPDGDAASIEFDVASADSATSGEAATDADPAESEADDADPETDGEAGD